MTADSTSTVLHTSCTLDCPDACSLAVTVTMGRITKVDASPEHDLTDGWICSKVKRHAERVYAPERVMTPLVRTGPKGSGEFRSATWDEALTLITGRMQATLDQRGGDGIAAFTYNSSASAVERNSMTEAFFAAIGATVIEHTICAATADASWQSVFPGMRSADPFDVVNSKYVVIWGANPTVSNTHFAPLVTRAVKENGAKVIVIDPRRTAMAARADLHLPILPGADAALAYAVARRWSQTGALDSNFMAQHADGAAEFLAAADEWTVERAAEVCGLEADAIRMFADDWATTRPAMLRIGWGQERNSNGGAACRAILSLPVVGGHFGVPGSGVLGSVSTGVVKPLERWPAIETPVRRELPLHQVGEWLAPGGPDSCDVVFVQGANPVVMCPDQQAVIRAFEREDVFTVVHEQVLTDTARYADVVLPATTSFEIDDVTTGYGTLTVQPVKAVIAPVGESRSNDDTGLALARAMGFDWHKAPLDVALADPGPRRVDVPTRQFVDVFPRGDKAQLVDAAQGVPRLVPIARDADELVLISPATSKLINSMFGEFQSPAPAITLSPADAAARSLIAGQRVRVSSAYGTIEVEVQVDAATRPGVAVMAKGVWLRNHPDGLGVNALTPPTGDPLVNGACFNDTMVRVERV